MEVRWRTVAFLSALVALLELSIFLFSLSVVVSDVRLRESEARLYAKAWIQLIAPQGDALKLFRFTDYYLASGGELREVVPYLEEGVRRSAYLKDLYFLAMGFTARGDDERLKYLMRASISVDPDVRRVANTYKLFILSATGKQVIIQLLRESLRNVIDERYLDALVELILKGAKLLGDLFLKKKVRELLDDPAPIVRTTALYLLAVVFRDGEPQAYLKGLSDPVPSVRLMALACLTFLHEQRLINLAELRDALRFLLKTDDEESVRIMSLISLRDVDRRTLYEVATGELLPEPLGRRMFWGDRSSNLIVARWRALAVCLLK